MHYIVDGYNLLFQTAYLNSEKSLSDARKSLIYELDSFAEAFTLHITLVFDASFQSDAISRSHYQSLEIIYTAYGQTADDYIVDWMEVQPDAKQITVVTSDMRLKARLKKPKLYVEKVRDFLQNLRKRRLKKRPLKTVKIPKKEKAKKEETAFVFDPKQLPPLSDLDTWEKIFLSKLQN